MVKITLRIHLENIRGNNIAVFTYYLSSPLNLLILFFKNLSYICFLIYL